MAMMKGDITCLNQNHKHSLLTLAPLVANISLFVRIEQRQPNPSIFGLRIVAEQLI